jgi:hypothetical protein
LFKLRAATCILEPSDPFSLQAKDAPCDRLNHSWCLLGQRPRAILTPTAQADQSGNDDRRGTQGGGDNEQCDNHPGYLPSDTLPGSALPSA